MIVLIFMIGEEVRLKCWCGRDVEVKMFCFFLEFLIVLIVSGGFVFVEIVRLVSKWKLIVFVMLMVLMIVFVGMVMLLVGIFVSEKVKLV